MESDQTQKESLPSPRGGGGSKNRKKRTQKMFLSSPRGGGSAIRRLGEKLMWVYIIISNVNNKTSLCQVRKSWWRRWS
jgi:hypothetical protein